MCFVVSRFICDSKIGALHLASAAHTASTWVCDAHSIYFASCWLADFIVRVCWQTLLEKRCRYQACGDQLWSAVRHNVIVNSGRWPGFQPNQRHLVCCFPADAVYLARWAASPVSRATIADNLPKIRSRRAVVTECLTRVAPVRSLLAVAAPPPRPLSCVTECSQYSEQASLFDQAPCVPAVLLPPPSPLLLLLLLLSLLQDYESARLLISYGLRETAKWAAPPETVAAAAAAAATAGAAAGSEFATPVKGARPAAAAASAGPPATPGGLSGPAGLNGPLGEWLKGQLGCSLHAVRACT